MHRISKLTLKNFKFFYGEVPINFDKKNVLLYGENGSGKSSIYWALYTFLQSSFKSPGEVVKYFDPKSEVNLRNRFATDEDESAITVTFDNGEERTISNLSNTTKRDKDDNFVLEATLGSDLIEYRTLARIYHFAHSDEVNLFQFFKDNLFPFINFKNVFTKHDKEVGGKNADAFWNYLDSGISIYKDAENDKSLDLFIPIVEAFNVDFDTYLKGISETMNTYLNEKFKQNIKVIFKYVYAAAKEDFIDEERKRIYATAPQIILEVELISAKLDENKKKVFNPQSFLNESKLTALALSMRLAILDEKFVKEYPNILVLDDFLMSMDMCNREAVLEIIFENYLADYQILFFTHQRGLFEDARKFIENLYTRQAIASGKTENESKVEWKEYWKFFEMYETESDLQMPVPKIQEYQSSLQKALYYFKENIDYNICGNNLRSALEEFFLEFIPHNFLNGQTMLAGLLVSARNYFTYVGFDTAPLDKLERYRDRSLNPTSHFNPRADYFKKELQEIFSILDGLKKNKNEPTLRTNEKIKFAIKTKSGKTFVYTAVLLENIRLYQKSDGTASFFLDNDERHYSVIHCIEGANETTFDNPTSGTLKGLYDETCAGLLQYKTETSIPETDMLKVFTDAKGKPLEQLKQY
jgi:energy-coupling factor transporter ATP-binding protein EcfA2